MGMVNQFKRFIPDFATMASPLYELLNKNEHFEMTSTRREAVENLKNALELWCLQVRKLN